MVKALEMPDDGIQEVIGVPAVPAGEFVIIEDELQEVYDVKADVDDFHYTFNGESQWTLQVQFAVVPNDEALPGSEARQNSGKYRYFYGLKVHLMVTETGHIVEVFFNPGRWNNMII